MAEPTEAQAQLLSLRQSIDNIDAALVHLLAERFKFTQSVGRLKAEYGLPPADPEREKQQIHRLKALAADSHLDPAFSISASMRGSFSSCTAAARTEAYEERSRMTASTWAPGTCDRIAASAASALRCVRLVITTRPPAAASCSATK